MARLLPLIILAGLMVIFALHLDARKHHHNRNQRQECDKNYICDTKSNLTCDENCTPEKVEKCMTGWSYTCRVWGFWGNDGHMYQDACEIRYAMCKNKTLKFCYRVNRLYLIKHKFKPECCKNNTLPECVRLG